MRLSLTSHSKEKGGIKHKEQWKGENRRNSLDESEELGNIYISVSETELAKQAGS